MRRIVIASAFAAAALFGAPALAQSVVGEWATVAETPQGNFEATLSVAEAEGGHTVTIQDTPPAGAPAGPPLEWTVSDVVVDGASLSFKRSASTPQGPFELSYALTADGDALSGTATSAFGAVPITGTRK